MKERALLQAAKAEAALGRLTVEHTDVLQANAQLWRIAESAGAITSDREDMLALYRR
jgi:predicted transcriptional regulator